jgi:hypothetical protein
MHNLYKSALALRVLFYFLHLLYIYSSPYLTRDTHYRLINYITFGVLLCVTYSDYLAVPIECKRFAYNYDLKFNSNIVYLKDNGSNITLTQAR